MAEMADLQALVQQQGDQLAAAQQLIADLQLQQHQHHQQQQQAAQAAAAAGQAAAQAAVLPAAIHATVDSKTIPTIGKVDGTEWLTFIRKFNRVVNLTHWNDAIAIERLCLAMNGEAYRAIQAIPTDGRTFEEVVADFQKRFLPAAAGHAAIGRFEAAKQSKGESLISWHARIGDLYMQAYPLDDGWRHSTQLIRAFTKGLSNEKVMDHTYIMAPTEFDQALTVAHSREGTLAMLPSNQAMARTPSAALHAVGGDHRSGAEKKQKGNCFVCGSSLHYRRDCPEATSSGATQARQGRRDGRRDRQRRGGRPRVAQIGDDQADASSGDESKN